MPKILKVYDPSDSFHKKMPYFDLPFKLLLNGKSQLSGKSSVLLNLLLLPEFGYDKELKILDYLEDVSLEEEGVIGLNVELPSKIKIEK